MNNMTQEQAAKRTGISATAISHFENGRREPSAKNIRKLAIGYNLSADFILGTREFERDSGNTGGAFGGFFNDAPKWAKYWACDANGEAHWYENKPAQKRTVWWVLKGRVKFAEHLPPPEFDFVHSLTKKHATRPPTGAPTPGQNAGRDFKE